MVEPIFHHFGGVDDNSTHCHVLLLKNGSMGVIMIQIFGHKNARQE